MRVTLIVMPNCPETIFQRKEDHLSVCENISNVDVSFTIMSYTTVCSVYKEHLYFFKLFICLVLM